MSDEDDDLDFTKPAKPSPPPPPERMAQARKEASVSKPELTRTGFYVAMAKRPPSPVIARNGSRHSVFVIEDDTDLSKLVGEILAKEGFLTRFARKPRGDQQRVSTSRACPTSCCSTCRCRTPTASRSSSASAPTRSSRRCR
jgi:hypothetical protein